MLSNYMGAATLGLYTLFITWMNLCLLVSRAGQDRVLIKELSTPEQKNHREKNWLAESVSLSFLLSVLMSLVLSGLVLLGVIKVPELVSTTQFLLCLLVTLFTGAVLTIVVTAYRAVNRVTLANIFESVPVNFLFALSLFVFAYWYAVLDNKHILQVFTLISAAVAMAALVTMLRTFKTRFKVSIEGILARLQLGLPFVLIFGTTSLNTSIDTIMVNQFLPIEQLAFYNVSLKLSSLVQFGLVIATSLVMAKFAACFASNDILGLKTIVNRTRLMALSLAIPVALCLFIGGDFIVSLWGDDFLVAKQSLVILASAQLLNVAFGPLGVMLTIIGKEKAVLHWSILTLCLNTFGNFILVPRYGITGAALSTACAVVLENIIFYVIAKQRLSLRDNPSNSMDSPS